MWRQTYTNNDNRRQQPMDKNNINITVNTPQQPMMIQNQTGCVVQAFWFLLVGWWAGAVAITLAYALMVFILPIPLAIAILNKLPYIMALRQPTKLVTYGGVMPVPQHNFIVRALWFLLVGWWLVAAWLSIAYVAAVFIVGLPLAFWMFDRVPALLTLRRSSHF
jgi:uncharacterized membrane protein YccF (DUF307 family)